MIERLRDSLERLAGASATGRGDAPAPALLADCADAARLALDCPQQVLTPQQHDALDRLTLLIDGGEAASPELAQAIADAHAAMSAGGPARTR